MARMWLVHSWHATGTQLAHPCGCCIDQLNTELMTSAALGQGTGSAATIRKVELGILGTALGDTVKATPAHCPMAIQLLGGSELPMSVSWACVRV